MLAEVVITAELSRLREGCDDVARNFVEVGCLCVASQLGDQMSL
jgi:hypothetical protein